MLPPVMMGSQLNQPVISVITVCRNSAATIERTIESVFGQTYPQVEYIIIDGASTDGTLAIIRGYEDRLGGWVSEPDRGLYDAMNKGLQRASGDFVHFLNSDDHYYDSEVLARIAPQLDRRCLCHAQLIHTEEDGRTRMFGRPFDWEAELRVSRTPQPALFVPLDIYREHGLFDLRYRIAADYEMMLRLARHNPSKFIPVPTTVMHAGGVSYRNMAASFREAMIISCRYGRPGAAAFVTFLWRLAKLAISRSLPQGLRKMLESSRQSPA